MIPKKTAVGIVARNLPLWKNKVEKLSMYQRFMVSVFAVFLLFAASTFVVAQVSPIRLQTVRGLVGEKNDIAILVKADSISFSGDVILEGKLTLSNPTVFYPEVFVAAQGTQLLDSTRTRENDSSYRFSITLRCTQSMRCDTLVRLRGEILAASDSVTDVRLVNMTLTDSRGRRMIPSTFATLTIGSIGTPLPIIRRPSLKQSYPNPAVRGNVMTWEYRIDEPSDITFRLYTALGQEVMRLERQKQSRGEHKETWTPLSPLPAGVYYVRFSSNSGDILQRCIIE